MSESPVPAAGSLASNRYHSLDALRAFAMLMGIFLHVAWLFLPYEAGAPVIDAAANQPCNYLFYVTHIFRMQVFYLLAGFFARLVFQRTGYRGFAWHRFSRIAVPFVVGWLIMYPLFTLYWVWGGIQSGRIIMDEPFWPFLFSRMRADELSWFSLTHLWFLYYLLLIYILAIGAELSLKHLLDRRGFLRQATANLFRWQMNSRLNIVWLSVPLWLCLWWIGDWFGITTPSDSLRPHMPVLTAYSYFFFVGWLLHGQTHLLHRFTQRWQLNLACGMAISVPLFVFFTRGNAEGYVTWAFPMVFDPFVAVFSAVYALSTWLLIFGLMGLFMQYFANPSPLVRYMADSSYWLYIIHLPIFCQINVLVAGYRWHWVPKTLFYTVIAFAIMMPSYHYLVRSTWLGRVLNG